MNLHRFTHPKWPHAWRWLAYICLLAIVWLGIDQMVYIRHVSDQQIKNQQTLCELVHIIGEEHVIIAKGVAPDHVAYGLFLKNREIEKACEGI